jgi:hypothetical protein
MGIEDMVEEHVIIPRSIERGTMMKKERRRWVDLMQ